MAERNTYIISKGFRNYFLFTILFMVAEQTCTTIDMIMVGNMVNADAFSALDLVIPLETVSTGIFMLMTGGAGILASRLIGDQSFRKANQILTVSAVSVCLTAAVFSAAVLAGLDRITSALCPDMLLRPYLKEYLPIYMAGLPAMAFYTIVNLIVNIDGKPQIALYAVLAGCVGDIVLNLVFMLGMDMGVAGLALSTVISYLIPLSILLPFIGSKKCSFKFTWPESGIMKMLKENTKAGFPYSLPYIIMCLITLLINSLVLKKLGSDALYVWSAGYQILSIIIVIMDCVGGTILVTMGSMLAGCQDVSGLKILIRNCSIITISMVGIIIIPVLLFPIGAASIFGFNLNGSDLPIAKWISCIALFGIPYCICCIKSYLNQALGRETGSTIQLTGFFIITIAAVLACSVFRPEWIFPIMPVAGIAAMILDAIVCGIIFRLNKNYSYYFLIPSYGEQVLMYQSVPYSRDGLNNALHKLEVFLDRCELSPALCINVNLACEEMMLSIVEHNDGKDQDYFFDVIILDDDNDVKITIKDAGYPFNPIRRYNDTAADAINAGDDADLSLRLVNKLCQELTYNYMYGQNTIYMSFKKP
ncbi:MAG: ATP-binding protein [Bacteroidaceae bacterium]|nr:ATP-binding protein [Bacteroidaceae bacterium]